MRLERHPNSNHLKTQWGGPVRRSRPAAAAGGWVAHCTRQTSEGREQPQKRFQGARAIEPPKLERQEVRGRPGGNTRVDE